MQVLKSLVCRLQSQQTKRAKTVTERPVPLTAAELKLVAGGLPRVGICAAAVEEAQAALPRIG